MTRRTVVGRDCVPAAGLLLALLGTVLILDAIYLVVALVAGDWIYAASLVLVAVLTVAATSVVRAHR